MYRRDTKNPMAHVERVSSHASKDIHRPFNITVHIHMHTHCLLIPSHERNARAKKAKNEPRRKSEDRSGKDRSDAAKRKALPKAERHRTAKRGVMLQSVERRRRGEAQRSGDELREECGGEERRGSNERKRAGIHQDWHPSRPDRR